MHVSAIRSWVGLFGKSFFILLKVSIKTILLFTTIPARPTNAVPTIIVEGSELVIVNPRNTPAVENNTDINITIGCVILLNWVTNIMNIKNNAP